MTTQRIEEKATKLVADMFGVEQAGSEFDVALKALTEAHQAGKDEAVEILEKMKGRYGTDGNSHCEIDECPTCQWNIGARWGSNQALDDTIKALKDNK